MRTGGKIPARRHGQMHQGMGNILVRMSLSYGTLGEENLQEKKE